MLIADDNDDNHDDEDEDNTDDRGRFKTSRCWISIS
jgi:hypothetical protein